LADKKALPKSHPRVHKRCRAPTGAGNKHPQGIQPAHAPTRVRSTSGDTMASRPEIKVTKKAEAEDVAHEAPNQRIKKEAGNYRLQVDRQTKAFYMTEEAAEAAGMLIKKGHPIVQVSIYNSAEGINRIIELPAA
jgi:hypothetical protein